MNSAETSALELAKQIIPASLFIPIPERYGCHDGVRLIGESGNRYLIHPICRTRTLFPSGMTAYGCIEFQRTMPAYDRVIATYLMIKNDEGQFLKTALWEYYKEGLDDIELTNVYGPLRILTELS